MATLTVACKLPNGLKLTHKDVTVELAGSNGADGAFGLTPGVDADWFNDWLATDGKDFAPVTSGVLFAQPTPDKAVDAAKERADVKTGQEPIDPANPGDKIAPATT
ncbi:MAG: hypothetical protein KGP14_15150 [Betaproteobacteria bacterium]|nr:hypothetical protein [Betaproteobacteria bacterium]